MRFDATLTTRDRKKNLCNSITNVIFLKIIDKQTRQDNLAAYDSLLKQGIKPIKPNPQELLEWQKSGGMATEHIQKAGLISPAMLQVLDGQLKAFRTNQKS